MRLVRAPVCNIVSPALPHTCSFRMSKVYSSGPAPSLASVSTSVRVLGPSVNWLCSVSGTLVMRFRSLDGHAVSRTECWGCS